MVEKLINSDSIPCNSFFMYFIYIYIIIQVKLIETKIRKKIKIYYFCSI